MIKYSDIPHTYEDENGLFISATTLLKRLHKEKDWDAIAKKYAKKHGIPVAEVKKKWEEKKNKAGRRGTLFHAIQEMKDMNQEFAATFSSSEHPPLKVYAPTIVEEGIKFGEYERLKDGIYPELLVWLNSVRVAGQIDRAEIYNNTLNIIDYKTNGKLEFTSFIDWKGQSEKYKSPCGHMDNCNGNDYFLQLNLYAYIILRNNPQLTLGKMIIQHILFEDSNNENLETSRVEYIVPNLQKEIHYILVAYKNKQL